MSLALTVKQKSPCKGSPQSPLAATQTVITSSTCTLVRRALPSPSSPSTTPPPVAFQDNDPTPIHPKSAVAERSSDPTHVHGAISNVTTGLAPNVAKKLPRTLGFVDLPSAEVIRGAVSSSTIHLHEFLQFHHTS